MREFFIEMKLTIQIYLKKKKKYRHVDFKSRTGSVGSFYLRKQFRKQN